MNVDLAGRVALVCASTKGIGFGVADALADSGAKVAICGRDRAALEHAQRQLLDRGGQVVAESADLASAADIDRLVDRVASELGPIDLLIANGGGPPTGETLDLSDDEWEAALSQNLLSLVRLCRLVVPGMRDRGWGRVVNLSSTTAQEPDPGMALSNVARAGAAAYVKTLAGEVGPDGVTVNTVLTGGVLSDRLTSLIAGGLPPGAGEDEVQTAIAEAATAFPVRFIPTPTQFAPTIVFLCSEEASFITGAAIPLEGGILRGLF